MTFIDLATAAPSGKLEADLCIIGTGAAGLTIATEFIGTNTQVLVLEAGGEAYSAESQACYQGHPAGIEKVPLETMRLRYYGGTTNHWTGLCRPLDPIDFQVRAWVPDSGWPIDKATLDPYAARTHAILDLGREVYDLKALATNGEPLMELAPSEFRQESWRLSAPTRFGPKYRAVLERAPNVRVVLNATVTDIALHANARTVDHLHVKDPQMRSLTVKARRYILATGGIENARLLLASRGVLPGGIGNQSDCVGRYFHDHPHVYTGTFAVFDDRWTHSIKTLYGGFNDGTVAVLPAIALADTVQIEEKTLRNAFSLFANTNLDASASYNALRRLLGADRRTEVGQTRWSDLELVTQDLGGVWKGVYGKIGNTLHPRHEFRMFTRAEQAPHRDSRVTLAEDFDAYGLPRVTLDWRMIPLDKHSLRVANLRFAREVGRLNIGRLQIPDWLLSDDDSYGDEFFPGGHHMGTTRMAASAKQGVVDTDCRVFGVDNLYVGGSSVFPTGGYANPTFTIVQMALRLADHLKALPV